MVLIGNDNKKRLSWPLAKIIELIPGRDGEIRTVRLKTQHGAVIHPVQRIFPLEVQAIANSENSSKSLPHRSGLFPLRLARRCTGFFQSVASFPMEISPFLRPALLGVCVC
ncbi:DUF5641 domain-containing protein [Trichonephila clavipes]|nr:DUF5641 domain-containing protein [Trichonephila clavipes]